MAKDDLQTLKAFVKAAGRLHPTMHYANGLWSVFILTIIKDFLSGPTRILVTCVGRQPGSNTWVFDEATHIDGQGHLISKDQRRPGVLLVKYNIML